MAQSILPTGGGNVKVIEGRGYEADGSVGFNAFAIVSFNAWTEVGDRIMPDGKPVRFFEMNLEAWFALGITFFVLGFIRPSGAFIGLGAAFLVIGVTRKRRHSN